MAVKDRSIDNSSLLVRASRGEEVERTPVWAMRQAGRWDPEFRKLRGQQSFYEFAKDPELAAAASLCPRRFGTDAIILFYDITTLAVAMGQDFSLVPGRGPVPDRPIRSQADLDRLTTHPDVESYRHVLETLDIVRKELDEELPTIVFAGAPFTLATYQIGTGKDIMATRRFIHEQPELWKGILEKTTEATIGFLSSLLHSGAALYQLFDSWAGALSREEYLEYSHPYHQRIFENTGGISVLFVKDSGHLDLQTRSGAKVISLGTSTKLSEMIKSHPDLVFQGNLDHNLLVTGTQEEVRTATRAVIDEGGGRRHVLNLDHGMDHRARPENFEAFVKESRIR